MLCLISISRKSRPKADQSKPVKWGYFDCPIKVIPFLIKVTPLLIGKSYIVFYIRPALEFCAYLDIIMIDSHYLTSATIQMADAYSEICQTTKMKHFVKIINDLNPWAIFAKRSILDIDRVLNKPLNEIKISLLTWNYYYCCIIVYCYLATKFLWKQLSTIFPAIWLYIIRWICNVHDYFFMLKKLTLHQKVDAIYFMLYEVKVKRFILQHEWGRGCNKIIVRKSELNHR